MNIRQAAADDSRILASMASHVYETDPAQLVDEFAALTAFDKGACFLAYEGDEPIGFAQCQLRHDYVEGTSTTPVGFLEGVWVHPAYRRQGVARQLVEVCCRWAAQAGCSEFASDCEMDNLESLAFHLALALRRRGEPFGFTGG